MAGYRWLPFSATELSKVIIILFFAKFFMDHEDDINTFRVLAESVLLLAVPLALIYAQPDMKNTITVTIIFCILLYIAGLSYKIIGGAILIAVPLLIIFFVYCCAARSDFDQGLSENTYYVFPLPGKRGIPGGY